ncbi:MAG: GNAT family N-acetyltransferase [Defluviitaleaceae bacterium]|nr:GNAT family N-acetyltransferase [Defluviitaleaceae bacterium]
MSNNEVLFFPCKWEEIHPYIEDYIESNKITIDSFWEGIVIASNHYKMMVCDDIVGFFAIHENSTITLFNVFVPYANQAQGLFTRVKKHESVTNAMVPTGDEFFISHCFDNFAKVEKQAYFAIYTEKEIPAERKKALNLRVADIDKDCETLKLSGDFFDGIIKKLYNGAGHIEIYVVEYDGNVVGFGVINYGRVLKNISSIGMYVCEQYRQQGIAANILEHLKRICFGKGYRVLSGCWYYNHNSKKSMENAGAYTKTRLVKFYF